MIFIHKGREKKYLSLLSVEIYFPSLRGTSFWFSAASEQRHMERLSSEKVS